MFWVRDADIMIDHLPVAVEYQDTRHGANVVDIGQLGSHRVLGIETYYPGAAL